MRNFISHITPLCSLLHMLLKDKCWTSENCKSLVLQDKCNIEIFLSPKEYHQHDQYQTVCADKCWV